MKTEIAKLREATGARQGAKIAVARMVSGLRYALCKKEIHETPSDERLKFFQKEEASRPSNWPHSEEIILAHAGKSNREQIRHLLGDVVAAELKKRGLPKLQKPIATALDLLGCDISHFFLHIERQFREGMGWHNFGKWHIDHIIPRSAFDLKTQESLRECFNFSNMQPLWARDNYIKGDKIYATVS